MSTEDRVENLSPEDLRLHIADMRRELVVDKMRILELQDEIRIRQTDHGDAISLLGQAELLLEGKIEYILNLDQTLNARIAELEAECDRKSEEIDRRGEAIAGIEAREQKDRAERDQVIQDLSERLETANQEVGKAHAIARDIDQERAAKMKALAATEKQLAKTRDALTDAHTATETAGREATRHAQTISEMTAAAAGLKQQLAAQAQELDRLNNALRAEQAQRATLENSAWWKLGRPWRALLGPKS
jgi:chromosome segregation ATPase